MSEMVERVAKALVEQGKVDGGAERLARIAIEAMRRPTATMVENSKRYMDSYSSNLEWWDSMISEALK